jgi:hypothetical protein
MDGPGPAIETGLARLGPRLPLLPRLERPRGSWLPGAAPMLLPNGMPAVEMGGF